MKKGMVFMLCILCALVFLSSTVFAWDDLIWNWMDSTIKDAPNASGRPLIRYSTAGDMYDKDGEKQSLADDATEIRVLLCGKYSIMDNLAAFAIVPIVSSDNGIDTESGIGDIWLGAKYAVIPEGVLTVRGALDLPTGDDEKGLGNAGGFGIDIAAMTGKDFGEIELDGQLGVRYNGEDGDTKWAPGIGVYVSGLAVYNITEQVPIWLALTYMNIGDGQADGNDVDDTGVNWLEIDLGTGYDITEDYFLGAEIQLKPMGTNTPADFGIAAYFGYRFLK